LIVSYLKAHYDEAMEKIWRLVLNGTHSNSARGVAYDKH